MRPSPLRLVAAIAAAALGSLFAAGCADGAPPAERVARPPIDEVGHRVCIGRPLPLTHIDEVVPGPGGRLAVVGRRTAVHETQVGVETVAWVVLELDPARPDSMRVIERADAEDRPTPIAWHGERLRVTRDRHRLVPADDAPDDDPPSGPPFGVPAVFDAETPHLATNGARTFMVVGEPSPRGPVLRTFVEVERGDPEAGTVDRVVATYGTLRREDLFIGFGFPVGDLVEAVGVTDWNLEPDGTLLVTGWMQMTSVIVLYYFVGHRQPVASDPTAGWFDEGALERGTVGLWIEDLPGVVHYDLIADADGASRLIYRDPYGLSLEAPLDRRHGLPVEEFVYYDDPPPFAHTMQVTTVAAVGDDRVLGGSGCVEPPFDETRFERPRCRAFVSRYVGRTAETRWTVTVDVDEVDHVIDVRPHDGRLVVLAAAFDPPFGRGSSTSPARLVLLDRAGNCLEE